jgi:hypothetical protein
MLTRGVEDFACSALARRNAHARDAGIAFVEEGHVYYRINSRDCSRGSAFGRSVTGLLHAVDPDPFVPADALRRIRASRNPNPKYAGLSDAQILAAWSASAPDGTMLHALMERHLNGAHVALDDVRADIVSEFRMLVAWLDAQRAAGWEPYRTEWVIYPDAFDVAGSVDCVLRHAARDEYMIVDWKRCDITGAGFERAFRDKRLLPPMDAHPASKRAHWQLQVNLYRHVLEGCYGLRVAHMCMVVAHAATNTTGAAVEIPHGVVDVAPLLQLCAREVAAAPAPASDAPPADAPAS